MNVYRLLLIAGLIVYGSLYPWRFDFAAVPGNPFSVMLRFWPELSDSTDARDAVLNIAVYFPLGAAAFLAVRQRGWRFAILGAVCAGAMLSVSVEALQVYIPGRTSSIFDVLCNLAGTAAGALAARFSSAWMARSPGFETPLIVLPGCWMAYHFFPFLPLPSLERLWFELRLLSHPCSSLYCCCDAPAWAAGIFAGAAEWFAAALAIQALFGRMRPHWIIAVLCIRLALRPIVLTRPLGPDEVLGALLALFLWKVLGEDIRLRAGLWLMLTATLWRGLLPLHFSAAPVKFAWVPFQTELAAGRETSFLDLLRKAYDYGAIVWLLRRAGVTYRKSGLMLAAGLAAMAMLQQYLPGQQPSTTDVLLAAAMALMFGADDHPANPLPVRY